MKLFLKLSTVFFFLFSLIILARALFLPGYPDFANYYYDPTMALNGINPYIGGLNLFTATTYPPFSFVFFLPFTIIPFILSARIFAFVSLVFLFLSLIIIFKIGKVKLNSNLFFLVSGLTFLYFPIKFTLGMGQINIIVLFLIMTFLYFVESKQKFIPGVFLGFSFLIKMFPVLVFPYLLFRKRYRIFIFSILFILIGVFVSFLIVPSGIYGYYITKVLPSLINSWPSDYYNQSITGVLSRSLGDSALRTYLKYVFILIIVVGSFFVILKSKLKNSQIEVGYLITANLLINFFSWQHHFVWLIIPLIFTLFYLIKNKRSRTFIVILFISYVLTAVNFALPLKLPLFFQSHVFFGALLLWIFSSFLLLKPNEV